MPNRAPIRLVHRTNYWGNNPIFAENSDAEVDTACIWVQMTRGKSCCPGFGNREMDVYPDDLLNQCEDDWNLWLVSEGQGNKTNHYFYKLVLIPKRTPGLGNKSCLSYGWLAVGAVDFNLDNAYEHLADMIRPYLQSAPEPQVKKHVHIAIIMDSLEPSFDPDDNPEAI